MVQLQKLDAMTKPHSEEATKKAEKRKKQREYNDLLFQDLCARLPYGVKFKWCDNFHTDYYTLIGINEGQIIGRNVNQEDCLFFIEEVKPYLRLFSNMTDEEWEECLDLDIAQEWEDSFGHHWELKPCNKLYDWLNAHYFDYRNLIEKGLAIEVTEDNNPYK